MPMQFHKNNIVRSPQNPAQRQTGAGVFVPSAAETRMVNRYAS